MEEQPVIDELCLDFFKEKVDMMLPRSIEPEAHIKRILDI